MKHNVTVDFGGIELTGALVHDFGILGLATAISLALGRGSGAGENRAGGR
ncbi:hypothetical protein ACIQWZ_36170 [Streptomyces sp. NPDC098077]